jgi:hypothetical protein
VKKSALLIVAILSSCKSTGPTNELAAAGAGAGVGQSVVCKVQATPDGSQISNYGWIGKSVVTHMTPPNDADHAATTMANFFDPSCQPAMKDYILTKKPNLYIYVTGFGGAEQENRLVAQPEVLKWIEKKDPGALVISISWSCDGIAAQFPWCKKKAAELTAEQKRRDPEIYKKFGSALNFTGSGGQAPAILEAQGGQSQTAYNEALYAAIYSSAHIINLAQVIGLGGVYAVGYSMGAHAAADLLVSDFDFAWSKSGQKTSVANLEIFKGSLALGLAGWSDAMFRYSEKFTPKKFGQYLNGGLLRIEDPIYNNKLVVLNRRSDPTSSATDAVQRGLNDVFFADYNYYAHDYSMPLFNNPGLLKTLEDFINNPRAKSAEELGIVWDSSAFLEFDDCAIPGPCSPSTNFMVKKSFRRPPGQIALGTPVNITDGFSTTPGVTGTAVDFRGSQSKPLTINSMDQQDLRGAVELHFRPDFSVSNNQELRHLFSYGRCTDKTSHSNELEPIVVIKGQEIIFQIAYLGKLYELREPLQNLSLREKQWTHLSFYWDLPVSLIESNQTNIQKFKTPLGLATGMRFPPPTSYLEQKGIGEFGIVVNGDYEKRLSRKLGEQNARRDCLEIDEVLRGGSYESGLGDGTYDPHIPYSRYSQPTGGTGDSVNAAGVTGQRCKAFRIRNLPVNFGCSFGTQSPDSSMDNIVLINGQPRVKFDNIDRDTGALKSWVQ